MAFSENIDDYGFPDWSDTDFDNYRLPIKNRPFSLISFSRGCPYACTFCAASTYYGRRSRKRSIKKIIEEIAKVHSVKIQFPYLDFLYEIVENYFKIQIPRSSNVSNFLSTL